jgi:hypothetical protein
MMIDREQAMNVERLGQAGREIAQALISGYRDERGVHAETIIGAAAALAGEFALRATGAELPKGPAWIVGGDVDKLLYGAGEEKATMWALLKLAATNAGVPAGELPDIREIVARTTNAIGKAPFPPLTIPKENYPREWSPDACNRFRGTVRSIAKRLGLSPQETATAIAFATMTLIEQTKSIVPPKVTVTLAAEIMVGVSRMAPVEQATH